MEKKTLQKKYNSLWAILSFRNINQFIFRKFSPAETYTSLFLKNRKGFTKIEFLIGTGLLVFITVVIANIAHPLDQIQKSHDMKRKEDLSQLQHALESYYQSYNRYPSSSSDFHIMIAKEPLQWGKDSFVPYSNLLPDDPTPSARQYVYYSDQGGQSYWVYASLEKAAGDQESCGNVCSLGNGIIPAGACSTNNSSAQCNFGVTSPNVSP